MNEEDGRKLRLFVAVELPQAWLDALAAAQDSMKAAIENEKSLSGMKMRWVRPESIHLTLKFIGEVGPEQLGAIREQLQLAIPSLPDVSLSLAGIGSFQDRRAPRVVWAGVRDQPAQALVGLAGSIETWLAAAGIPKEKRGFRPHLTLARLPEGLPDAQRKRAAELTGSIPSPNVAPFRLERVSLMQSFLGPGGARYERLGSWPD